MNGDSAPPRKRRRPALACEQCRRRKIRCDRNTPCDQCIRSRSKSESCTYLSDDYPTSTARSPRINRLQSSSPPVSSATNDRTPASPTTLPGMSTFDVSNNESIITGDSTRRMPLVEGLYRGRLEDNTSSPRSLNSESSVQTLIDRVQQLEKMLLNSANTQPVGSLQVPQPIANGSSPLRGNFSKSMFYGPSHWMNVIEQVRAFIFA